MSADPARYRNRLLIAVVGLTPQVVTETLYALVVRRPEPFVPTGLHLITTTEGARRLRRRLLDRVTGELYRFAADYRPGLAPVLRRTRVEVIRARGRAVGDIASTDDSMAAADGILAAVRAATRDPDCAIVASIAGGRKTMGFLLGYALSLYGRAQDRLTHVLVNAPFQDHPGFYFPPRRPRALVGPGGARLHTRSARVVLTEIPFVRLRDGLPHRLLAGRASYAATVREAQTVLPSATLAVDRRRRRILCGGTPVELPPVEFAFAAWIASRHALPHRGAVSWREASAGEFLAFYRDTPGVSDARFERVERALRGGIERAWFEQRVTRFNKLVERALGTGAINYRIEGSGRRPTTRYGFPQRLGSIAMLEKPGEGSQQP